MDKKQSSLRRVQLFVRLKRKIPSESIESISQMESCLVLKILSLPFSVVWTIYGIK